MKVKDNPSDDFRSMYRHFQRIMDFLRLRSWMQVLDCTAEGSKVISKFLTENKQRFQPNYLFIFLLCFSQCCLLFSMIQEEMVRKKTEPGRLQEAINVLLSLQVRYMSIGISFEADNK